MRRQGRTIGSGPRGISYFHINACGAVDFVELDGCGATSTTTVLKKEEDNMSKKGILVALAMTAALVGCTAKIDPADMQKIDAAVSRSEAAANKADAAARSAAQAAQSADAAAQKCEAVATHSYRK